MQNTTERKVVYGRITAQIVEYLKKVSVRGMLSTPAVALPVRCALAAALSIPESHSNLVQVAGPAFCENYNVLLTIPMFFTTMAL